MFFSKYIYLCSKYKVHPLHVASECDFNESIIYDWKNKFKEGKNIYPSTDILLRLSKYFKVSVDYLLDNEPKLDLNEAKKKFLYLKKKDDIYSLVSDEPFIINNKEAKIIKAYRSNPQKQKLVDDILDIKAKKDDSK